MFEIRKITASETYPLRHSILRPNEPIEKCVYAGDESPSTMHFGLFDQGDLAGIVSVYATSKELFHDAVQFQIRGMAVVPTNRKKGYGAALILHVIETLQIEKNFLIWFNARIVALGFYEKMGFEKTGEIFEIIPIGMHYIMYRRFTGS